MAASTSVAGAISHLARPQLTCWCDLEIICLTQAVQNGLASAGQFVCLLFFSLTRKRENNLRWPGRFGFHGCPPSHELEQRRDNLSQNTARCVSGPEHRETHTHNFVPMLAFRRKMREGERGPPLHFYLPKTDLIRRQVFIVSTGGCISWTLRARAPAK